MVVILAAIQSFIYVDRHLRIPMMNVAKVRMNQVATQAINQAITEQVASQASFDKLIDWKTSGEGKISGFMLNYSEHMKITAETIDTVSRTLYDLQHLKESIPIGHALGSAILSSYGPRVPVQFEPVGATQVQLNTRQSSIGINNTLVEVYIKVVTEISIIIPFDTEPQKVEAEIPVSYLLVVGDVPMYYYDNKGNPVGDSAGSAPNISVPLGGEEGPQGTKRQEESGNVPGAGGQEESGGGAGIITPPAGEQPGTSVPDGTQQEAGDGSGGSNGR
jgi:sporulation protein YunB